MEKKQPCAGMLIISEGKVLLVRSNKDRKWGMPFGKGEPGESPLETAIRETREETGITVTDAKPLFQRYLADGSLAHTYLALEYEGTPQSSAEGLVEWCPLWFLCGPEGRFPEYNSDMVAIMLGKFLKMTLRESMWDQRAND